MLKWFPRYAVYDPHHTRTLIYTGTPSVGFESEPSTKRSKDISLRSATEFRLHYNIIIFRLFGGNRRLRNLPRLYGQLFPTFSTNHGPINFRR